MEIPILHLPLDEFGTAETHRKTEEYVVDSESFYLVYPEWGPFFTGSVELFDQEGNELKRSLDWEPFLPYQQASMDLGAEVHRAVVIKSTTITKVSFTRQVVGGIYSNANVAFDELLKEFKQNKSKINWDDVIHPDKFVSTDHPHHSDDLMGTQDVVHAIGELTEVVRWYLTGRLIEIENVTGLRPELDTLHAGVSENKQGIATLVESIRGINDNLDANQSAHEVLQQNIDANKQRLDTHAQHINTHATAINNLNAKVQGVEQVNSRQDQELESLRGEVERLDAGSNTISYGRGILSTTNNQITRLHHVTIYDKLTDADSSHVIDPTQFVLGDTLVVNMALIGDYSTTLSVVNGSIVLQDKSSADTQDMRGNGNIELRYLGNRVFQAIGLR